MSRLSKVLLFLGILLGAGTAGGVYMTLNQAAETQAEVQPVVVAALSLPARSPIQAGDLAILEYPIPLVPPGALKDPQEAVGKLLASELHPGQALVRANLITREEAEKSGSTAALLVPPGMVAVAFPISQISGVAGAVERGDRVDILLTLEIPEETTGLEPVAAAQQDVEEAPVTQLLLQNVEVLHVGAWNAPQAAKKAGAVSAGGGETVVTFLLEPQDALALKFARERGVTLDLALRAAGDKRQFETESVDLEYMRERFRIEFPRR